MITLLLYVAVYVILTLIFTHTTSRGLWGEIFRVYVDKFPTCYEA